MSHRRLIAASCAIYVRSQHIERPRGCGNTSGPDDMKGGPVVDLIPPTLEAVARWGDATSGAAHLAGIALMFGIALVGGESR